MQIVFRRSRRGPDAHIGSRGSKQGESPEPRPQGAEHSRRRCKRNEQEHTDTPEEETRQLDKPRDADPRTRSAGR